MIKTFQNILQVLTSAEKRKFILLIILNIIISVADITALALLVLVINFYIHPENSHILDFLPDWILDKNSLAFIALFFFLFGLKNFAAYLVNRAQHRFVFNVASRISTKNLLRYFEGSFESYTHIDSAAHIRRIGHEPIEFSQYVLSAVQQIITQGSLILFAITAIILYNLKLFFILLIILLPPIIFVAILLKKRLRSVRSEIQTSNEKMLQHLREALVGYVESHVYDKNEFFADRYSQFQKILTKRLAGLHSIQALPNRLIEVFALLGLFILIVISKWLGGNSVDIITIGAFMAAAYRIIPGIVHILNAAGQLKVYGYTAENLIQNKKDFNQSEKVTEKSEEDRVQSVEFRNIYFRYKEQNVLDNCSFSICKRDFLGISGLSGKGKTTMMNLLLGFLDTQTGNIFINGKETDTGMRKNFLKNISYVKQQPFLLHDSILCNIVWDNEKFDKTNLDEVIHVAGMNERTGLFTGGLRKIITENGKNISGGQRQRIAIARALYKNADLIILDEPFSELDEETVQSLLNYFQQLAKEGKLVILIAHDKKSLSYCSKIVSLDK